MKTLLVGILLLISSLNLIAQDLLSIEEINPNFPKIKKQINAKSVDIYNFSENEKSSLKLRIAPMSKGYKGVRVKAVLFPEKFPENKNTEYVFVASFYQLDSKTNKPINKLTGVPVRNLVKYTSKTQVVELESCYYAIPNIPIYLSISRLTSDPADTYKGNVGLISVKIESLNSLPEAYIVEDKKGYNSWPMMQAWRGKLVCIYTRGSGHTINEGARDTYVKVSSDNGKTWSEEKVVSNDKNNGEVPIGKGLDEDGNLLFWIRFMGKSGISHRLFRSTDGENFVHILTPKFNPMPMQVTDVFHVENVGLMSLWFTSAYDRTKRDSWGTLVSKDNGKTWTQTVIESGLDYKNWNTEQSAVYLGNGRILAIGRVEVGDNTTEKSQFQLESCDYGKTWTRKHTNITDVYISTPSLIYDKKTGLISNYYYQRGRGMLKRRVVEAEKIFGNPLAWTSPEIVAFGSACGYDAGNVNATEINGTHYIAYYSGDKKNAKVVVSAAGAPTQKK